MRERLNDLNSHCRPARPWLMPFRPAGFIHRVAGAESFFPPTP